MLNVSGEIRAAVTAAVSELMDHFVEVEVTFEESLVSVQVTC